MHPGQIHSRDEPHDAAVSLDRPAQLPLLQTAACNLPSLRPPYQLCVLLMHRDADHGDWGCLRPRQHQCVRCADGSRSRRARSPISSPSAGAAHLPRPTTRTSRQAPAHLPALALLGRTRVRRAPFPFPHGARRVPHRLPVSRCATQQGSHAHSGAHWLDRSITASSTVPLIAACCVPALAQLMSSCAAPPTRHKHSHHSHAPPHTHTTPAQHGTRTCTHPITCTIATPAPPLDWVVHLPRTVRSCAHLPPHVTSACTSY
ncbi:hypothetical protein JB92DRAFT_1735789 [Gautieria morchelliformis]|nr:hypothetical protein JB92DRAFT_1735789 [Gautieria morchelliformis]